MYIHVAMCPISTCNRYYILYFVFSTVPGGAPSLASNDSENELDNSNGVKLSVQQYAQSLQEEGGPPIIPVSPAPRDQRSSYSSHTQFKIKTIEESLQILDNSKSERKMSSNVSNPTSAIRLPVNKTDMPKNTIQSSKTEDAYMLRVLPKFTEIPQRETSKIPSQSTTAPLSDGPEDIETIDVFSTETKVCKDGTCVSHKVDEPSSSSPTLTKENSSGTALYEEVEKSSLPSKNDISDSPMPSKSVTSVKGVASVGPKELKLPPLIMSQSRGE